MPEGRCKALTVAPSGRSEGRGLEDEGGEAWRRLSPGTKGESQKILVASTNRIRSFDSVRMDMRHILLSTYTKAVMAVLVPPWDGKLVTNKIIRI